MTKEQIEKLKQELGDSILEMNKEIKDADAFKSLILAGAMTALNRVVKALSTLE